MQSAILKLHKQIISGKKTIKNIVEICCNKHEKFKKCNTFITPTFNEALKQATKLDKEIEPNADNILFGIPYSLKDLICTMDIPTTGGSPFLKNYVSPFNATLYEKLISKNSILVGKVNLDEFGLGAVGLHSHAGETKSVIDAERICGGSSSGSANSVASGECVFSIGTDTGDSVRRPASFLGVVGYKPSYGLISRYGVYPYAPSLDTVGVFTTTVLDSAIVVDAISGFDKKDYSSQNIQIDLFKTIKPIHKIKFAVLERIEDFLAINERKIYLSALEKIKSHGHIIKTTKIEPTLLNSLLTTYRVISYTEAISCYANLTGITFGESVQADNFEKMILENRTNGFNWEAKRRFSIGSLMFDYMDFEKTIKQAKKVRQIIVNKANDIFDEYVLLLPSASSGAPLITDVKTNKYKSTIADDVLLIANFGGFPSITIPIAKDDQLPFGLNINLGLNRDKELLSTALTIESIFQEDDQEEVINE